MASRRNFTRNQKEQIVERAKNAAGQICCEGCKHVLGLKKYEIDHIIAEALRPEADKQRKITIAEGQLLGMECCHRGEGGKTNADVTKIAKAKRQYDNKNGLAAKKRPIPSPPKPEKPAPKQHASPRRSLYAVRTSP
jgi:hypothetical protein